MVCFAFAISNAAGQPPTLPDLRATVKFVRGQIVIANRNDYTWKACSFDINPNNFEWDFFTRVDEVLAHAVVTLEPKQFRGARQEPYDPGAHPPVSMRLVCDIPDGSRSAIEIIIG
jgi:hypothetical protein